MISDIAAITAFRSRRIIETFEDALVLLRHYHPRNFEAHRLSAVASLIESASPTTRDHLCEDPKVQMWSLVDLGVLANSTGATEIHEFAEELANQLNYIGLGIACLERQPFSLVARLPKGMFIPGIGTCLDSTDAESELEISSSSEGVIRVNGDAVMKRQWLSAGELVLPLDDPLLRPPALDGYELAELDAQATEQWMRALTDIRPLLNASGPSRQLVESFGRFILPLRPSANGNHLSVSFKHRPSIIYASWSQDSLDILEALVHEADHQCLFEVINEAPLFVDDPINTVESYRSPWRADPRPLTGLFYGFSAFVTVGAFWEALLSSGIVTLDRIGGRAVLALQRSLDAISLVRENAVLTDHGQGLLEYNRLLAEQSLSNLSDHASYTTWNSGSKQVQAEAAAKWKLAHGGNNVKS